MTLLRILLIWLSLSLPATICGKDIQLRVMSFNLWAGGDGGGQPLEQSARVIEMAKADIVGFQETHGLPLTEPRPDNAKKLAQMLGWNYFDQGGRKAIISRYVIETNTPNKQGVTLLLPNNRRVFVFNVHFFHAPYQPYQLAGIPYAGGAFLKTEAELIDAAQKARGHEVELLLSELRIAVMSGLPVFLTGDFNEPSHLDWNEKATAAGKAPLKVAYPATRAITAAGMHDAFRELFPDVVSHRGNTWTPIKTEDDPTERHDRIDFVFFSGSDVKLRRCEIVGEKTSAADIVVTPYPSDHRSVVGTFVVKD
jgi:exodeoxyribonuclease-3